MDYEQKYKAALEWMRDVYPTLTGTSKEDAEHFFPELTESEDERIRKDLIGYLAHRADVTAFIDEGEDCKRWIAYLEKRKEPNYCHHEVDLSGCSEEYSKGYYDGWNNCNQQHSQLEAEQKSEQSEMGKEYVRTLHSLISDFLRGKCGMRGIDREYYQKIWDWLDNRHIEQKPAEWSEEDEKIG